MNEREFELVQMMAKGIYKKNVLGRLYEPGDLYGAGWEAVEEFHEKFAHLSREACDTYDALMKKVIKRRMTDHVRTLRKRYGTHVQDLWNHTQTFSDFSYSGEKEPFEVTIAAPDNRFSEVILQRDEFEYMIKTLSLRSRQIMRLWIEQEFCYKEIAELLGLTESRICQIINHDIFPALERWLQHEGYVAQHA